MLKELEKEQGEIPTPEPIEETKPEIEEKEPVKTEN